MSLPGDTGDAARFDERSREEADLLERNVKKYKVDALGSDVISMDVVQGPVQNGEDMDMNGGNPIGKETVIPETVDAVVCNAKAIFRDSLIGERGQTNHHQQSYDDLVSDDDKREENDPECPVIRVTREEKVLLRRP